MTESMFDSINALASDRANLYETFSMLVGNDNIVEVRGISAMVNRGFHTGDVIRLQYRINGKRASAATVENLLISEGQI